MEFKEIGDTITQSEFNALVYLLRKFKRLTTTLKIGSSDLTSDFGNYHFTSGFKNFGANWIITDDVTVTSDDVLKNCYYSFIFTVIDVNLSGEVNRRLVTVDSESTGDTGTLEVIIPSDLIAENEVILPDFNVELVFDEHEYYTPLPSVEFDISINKRIIVAEESVVITGVLTEKGETLPNKIVNLNVGGTVHRLTTDNQGKITYTYTGTGNKGRVIVSAFDEVAWFYDGLDGLLTVTCVKPRIAFGAWLVAEGDVLVDWGDGLSQITQSRGSHLSHDYTDGVTEHIILLDGNITRLGDGCFYSSRAFESITYVGIPDSVTSLGESCFEDCRSINKMVIPKSITNIGVRCFKNCFISDYQLYWTKNPVPYSTSIYSTNNNPKFTIPYGTMQLYIDAGYPAAKLVERPIEADTINITSTKDILSSHDSESATITATLSGEDIPIPNTDLDYTIVDKDDNLLDDGTVTTNANGEASIVYTASGVGDVTVTFSLRSLLQKTYELCDAIQTFFKGTETFSKNPVRTYANYYSITDGVYSESSQPGGGNVSDTTFQCNSDWECTFEAQLGYGDGMRYGIHSVPILLANNIEGGCFGLRDYNNKIYIDSNTGSTGVVTTLNRNYNSSTWYSYKLVANGDTLSIYINDVLVNSKSGYTWLNDELCLYSQTWANGSQVQIKNFVFKAL